MKKVALSRHFQFTEGLTGKAYNQTKCNSV